ncbi:unnamed protein product [Microthlaspi erraticum]|uniref:HAT C-terminal dimerisation domain-containing protein n=1 Tax=Microthlaspi erraticum TaxID=1685480 RepID=A0A6D2I202_9BRAS|nr:unnamed protein product [Microthlaspi erraticum]
MEDWEAKLTEEEEMMMSSDDDDVTHDQSSEIPQDEGQANSRKKRRKTSEWWEHYTEIGVDPNDGKNRVKFNYCDEKLLSRPNTGTSVMKRHHLRCIKKPKYGHVGNMIIDADGKTKKLKIDQTVVREMFSKVIIRHDLPFAIVEYEEVRRFLQYLNRDYKLYSRNTAAMDVVKTWESEKKKLKLDLENIPSRICLTSDCWTAISGEGYISLTAHYVDEKWNLNSKILLFCDMPPPHTGDALASKIYECLKEWGIEEKIFTLTLDNASKIFTLTLDNASANDTMQDILKERLNLDDNLLCGGEFFHVRCSAHILNLIVQDGLKIISGALAKIRDSVKYVKASRARGIAFQQCVEGDDEVVLSMDVQTRWNSTFLMLERALNYQRAFNRLKVVDKLYKNCPSDEEWGRASKICDILRPFYKITTLMSGTSYSTSNLYFGHVWKIERLLRQNSNNDDNLIQEMASKMQIKFDKYWDQYSIILAMGAVLDPRMKTKLLKRLYEKLDDPLSCKLKLDHLKKKMAKLFEEYEKRFPMAVNSRSPSFPYHHPTERGRENFDNDLFDLDDAYDAADEGKSILDVYLEEPKLEMKNFPDMCVLTYWKENRHRFGPLSIMACDVLSIPITTVASESSFSIGSRVLNKYRSRLLPKHVQALLCTRSWLFGFTPDEKDNGMEGDGAEEVKNQMHSKKIEVFIRFYSMVL